MLVKSIVPSAVSKRQRDYKRGVIVTISDTIIGKKIHYIFHENTHSKINFCRSHFSLGYFEKVKKYRFLTEMMNFDE